MPDPVTGGILLGGSLIGGGIQADAAKKSAKAGERAADAGIAASDRALESFNRRTQPSVNLGDAAGVEIANLLGLSLPDQAIQTEISDLEAQLASIDQTISAGPPKKKKGILGGPVGAAIGGGILGNALTGEIRGHKKSGVPFDLASLNAQRTDLLSKIEGAKGRQTAHLAQPKNRLSQLEEINPLLSFLRDQGFEDIQESAAARGRLGAGGTLKDLTEFNTNLSATIVPQAQSQRFNELANILGIGTNAATGQGNAALQTGVYKANLLSNRGAATAGGITGKANAITNTLENISGVFGESQGFV